MPQNNLYFWFFFTEYDPPVPDVSLTELDDKTNVDLSIDYENEIYEDDEDEEWDETNSNFENNYESEISNIKSEDGYFDENSANDDDDTDVDNNLFCDLCEFSKTFLNVEDLESHISIVHQNLGEDKSQNKDYQCEFCEKSFNKSVSLKVHIRKLHKNPRKDCKLCEKKSFASTSALKKHMDDVHKGLKKFKCELCDKKFKSKVGIEYHKNFFHGDPETVASLKPYKCDLCELTFDKQSRADEHKSRVHLRIKNFKCHLCNMKYR